MAAKFATYFRWKRIEIYISKSRYFQLQHFVAFSLCIENHSQHCKTSLTSNQCLSGFIWLVNFRWQHNVRGFLTAKNMYLALEHRRITAAKAPLVKNDQYQVQYLHAEYG